MIPSPRRHSKRGSLLLLIAMTAFQIVQAQPVNRYSINIDVPEMKIYADHLKMGGVNPKGDKIAVNNYYLSLNDKPFLPITGEFHFSRYAREYWDESIKKMKAGGINVIATYLFWNMHEENEGKFDWAGDKDVRKFIELCAANNMYVIVRIGPFGHGEIRSGGLPDWLMGKPLTIRSNDPNYLLYVDRFYKSISEQLTSLYFKDGGPIIGIQLENEYQHSAAPWGLTYPGQPHDFTASGRDLGVTQQGVGIAEGGNPYAELGNDHMKALKALALKHGMNVPIYTATGWGYAAIIPNETIPVTAAYAYPFWTEKKDLSPFFLYKDMHKDPDYSPVRYKPEDYPAFPAELGSGIMSVYTRRPIAVHKSFDAMINRCLGSGANGVGYYMYHGGSTPRGQHYYYSDEAYGLPKISYDFQAPIGEFGQVREGFHRLKLLHFFMNEFGSILGPMQTILPANAASLKPNNVTDLRYAVRAKGNSGFLFINNFQDDTVTAAKNNIQITIKTKGSEISIPRKGGIDIPAGENIICPFNFDVNGAKLEYATAQLLMKGDDAANPYYVFFAPGGLNPEFSFTRKGVAIKNIVNGSIDGSGGSWLVKCGDEGASFTVKAGGRQTQVLVIPKSFALQSYIVTINGKRHLAFSEAVILQNGNDCTLLSNGKNSFSVSVYPAITGTPQLAGGTIMAETGKNLYSVFNITLPPVSLPVKTNSIDQKKLVVSLPSMKEGLNNIYLTIDYTGDTGMGFLDGELVTDEFYKGIPWEIGLRKFLPTVKSKEFVFYFRPVEKTASYLIDLDPSDVPDFSKERSILKINSVQLTPEYKSILKF